MTRRGVLVERLSLIGNFVGVYLKQEVKCVKTKCLGQIAEEQREEKVVFCSRCTFKRARKVRVKKFSLSERIFLTVRHFESSFLV